jgi:hypothetical protein
MRVSQVRNPVRYLAALIAKAKAGSFQSELAARAEESHRRSQAIAAAAEVARKAPDAATLPINVDGLPARLREIVSKHVRIASPAEKPATDFGAT